jgi:methylmalonyl-CoA mutase N-terminal domain/subunit
VEEGRDSVVGVNRYAVPEKEPINTLKIDFRAQRSQVTRLERVRRERDGAKVRAALARIEKAFENESANAIQPMMDAVTEYATLGEVVAVGKKVWGDYREPAIL